MGEQISTVLQLDLLQRSHHGSFMVICFEYCVISSVTISPVFIEKNIFQYDCIWNGKSVHCFSDCV